MHIKILQTIFIFVCIIIFGYFTYQSLSKYFAYNTVPKQNLDRQESQLMLRICFSSRALAEKKLHKLGISLNEYTQGMWTSNFVNHSTAKEYEIKQIFGQIPCLHSWLTDTLDTKPATSHAPTWTLTTSLRKYNYDSDGWKLSSSNKQSDFCTMLYLE